MAIKKNHVSKNLLNPSLDFNKSESFVSETIRFPSSDGGNRKTAFIYVNPNTAYTFSMTGGDRLFIAEYNSRKTADELAAYTSSNPLVSDNVVVHDSSTSLYSYTFTTGANTQMVSIYYSLNNVATNVMFNEGSTPLPYEPYGDSFKDWFYREYETATDTITSLPQTIIGDGQNISAWSMKGNMTQSGTPTPSNPIYPSECGDKTANLFNGDLSHLYPDGSNHVMSNSDMYSIIIKMSAGQVVTYSNIYSTSFQRYVLTDTEPQATMPCEQYTSWYGKSVTITNSSQTDKWLVLTPYRESVTTTTVETYFANVMVNNGSTALPYQPYGYKIPILSNGVSYPVYLAEPIRKIGDSVDTAASTGAANRVIKKLVLTGEESWIFQGSTSTRTVCSMVVDGWANEVGKCTHIDWKSSYTSEDNRITYSNRSLFVGFENSVLSEATQAGFIAYLAQQYTNGTPVTIWYVLATAQTESVTAPSIPTSGTAQTFDVSTTLKPSEVNLTYHGWHEHSDTKFTTP